jgi:hypothetical protein
MSWIDEQVDITRLALAPLNPLLRQFLEMLEEEHRERKAKEKFLSR